MNSRERVMRCLNFQEVDRVPFDMSVQKLNELIAFAGFNNQEDLLKFLGIDFRVAPNPLGRYKGQKRYHNGFEANYWGIPINDGEGDSGKNSPLAKVSSVMEAEGYLMPDFNDFDYSHIGDKSEQYNKEFAVVCVLHAPIFHNFTWLCGVENALVLLIEEPEIAQTILRRVTDFWIGMAEEILTAGRGKIDIIINHNDFGTQRGLIMNPNTWRTLIKPEFKRLYEVIHKHEAKVYQHSCGAIAEIIPDFIEIGADILDPIQINADGMDPNLLAEKFGGKIVFHGGIDTQNIMPFGTVDDVRKEVRKIISILNSKGGYILSGSQTFTEEIPFENILAVYDEAKKVK